MQTFTRWVTTPENRSALLAVQRLADDLCSDRQRDSVNPLLLHGPSGTGKTHLGSALVADVTRRRPGIAVTILPAAEFSSALGAEDGRTLAAESDLLVVEDLQHLAEHGTEAFVTVFDERCALGLQIVFTSRVGPALLDQPARLTSRLASGLVVGLESLSPSSRLAFLRDRIERRQLAVSGEVLSWLAENLNGSGRQLEGAVSRLETLARLHKRLPALTDVAAYFQHEAEATRPTVERIGKRVGDYFQIETRQLKSRRRSRNALLPRQIGMYLARQLTRLSLKQIGDYFGGRDHSTVLHACRKVERALAQDAVLSGAVRQLHADLA